MTTPRKPRSNKPKERITRKLPPILSTPLPETSAADAILAVEDAVLARYGAGSVPADPQMQANFWRLVARHLMVDFLPALEAFRPQLGLGKRGRPATPAPSLSEQATLFLVVSETRARFGGTETDAIKRLLAKHPEHIPARWRKLSAATLAKRLQSAKRKWFEAGFTTVGLPPQAAAFMQPRKPRAQLRRELIAPRLRQRQTGRP